MIDLILDHPWVLSANFHDGAVVVSYPYDDYRENQNLVSSYSGLNIRTRLL